MRKYKSVHVGKVNIKSVVLYSSTPVDYFLSQPISDKAVAVTNPLIMLLNQKRLASIPDKVIENWFNVGSLPDNFRDKLTDDQRFDLIKSKYIQSASDLKTYVDYLDSTILSEKSKLEAQQYALKQEALKKEAEAKAAQQSQASASQPVASASE